MKDCTNSLTPDVYSEDFMLAAVLVVVVTPVATTPLLLLITVHWVVTAPFTTRVNRLYCK